MAASKRRHLLTMVFREAVFVELYELGVQPVPENQHRSQAVVYGVLARRRSIVTTPPLAGLLAGLRLAIGTGRQKERDVLLRVSDWRTLARLARHHRIVTPFLQGMRAGGVLLPNAMVEEDLAARSRRQLARGRRQLEAMRQATTGLSARGIPALVLKGLPLSQRLYGNPFAKTSIDIDLLVPSDAFAAAGHALRASGWRRVWPDFPQTPARARRYSLLEKEHVFVKSGSALELHQRLLRNPFLFDPSFTSLETNARTVEIAGHAFRTLGDTDQVLYLACHGSLHYWQRLKWLYDFGALLGTIGDDVAEEAVARGRSERLDGLIAAAVLLSRQVLGVEPPAATAQLDFANLRTRFIAGLARRTWTPRAGIRRLVREATMGAGRIFAGSGMRYKLHEARSLLVQPQDFGKIDLPDRLFWLYYLLRPVLWISRVFDGKQSKADHPRP